MFELGSDAILVSVDGNNVRFSNTSFGAMWADISGLKLNYTGVIREHPDLETNPDWKRICVERFKEKIKSFKTEKATCEYIVEDLTKFGYKIKWTQQEGHRPIRIK